MTAVDPVFAQWLQAEALWFVATDAALAARWGTAAATGERLTTIALAADAEAEGNRQLAFLGGPLVRERHLVKGRWASLLGRVVTLTIAQLGHDAGTDVFVVGAEDQLAAGTSWITVLRRL